MDAGNEKLSRRGFLELMTFAIGGLVSFLIGIPAIAYLLSPALKENEESTAIVLGPAEKVVAGIPTLFRTRLTRRAGWITEEQDLTFYVLTDDHSNYVAFSNVCTHLSCRVRWVEDEEQFFCPCHNAVFDKEGEVVSGPPPRALDRFPVKEEDGQLYIEPS